MPCDIWIRFMIHLVVLRKPSQLNSMIQHGSVSHWIFWSHFWSSGASCARFAPLQMPERDVEKPFLLFMPLGQSWPPYLKQESSTEEIHSPNISCVGASTCPTTTIVNIMNYWFPYNILPILSTIPVVEDIFCMLSDRYNNIYMYNIHIYRYYWISYDIS